MTERTLQCGLEPFAVKRFEEIIDGVHLESAQSELIVCGHKNHRWPAIRIQFGQNPKPIQFRHLDVQENQIGSMGLDCIESFPAVGTFRNELDARLGPQKIPQTLPGERFIISNQYTD